MTHPRSLKKEVGDRDLTHPGMCHATFGYTLLATTIIHHLMCMTLDLKRYLNSGRLSGSPQALLRNLSVLPIYWFQMPFGTRARLTSSASQGRIFFLIEVLRFEPQGWKIICLFGKSPSGILVSSQEEVRFIQPDLPDVSSLCQVTFRKWRIHHTLFC